MPTPRPVVRICIVVALCTVIAVAVTCYIIFRILKLLHIICINLYATKQQNEQRNHHSYYNLEFL